MGKRRFRKLFIILFLCRAMIPIPLHSTTNLSKNETESISPAVAVNERGEVLVVWTEEDLNLSKGHIDIYYNFYKNGIWQGPKNAGIVNRGEAWTPRLAMDSGGNFHIAYTARFYDEEGKIESSEIYHAVYFSEIDLWTLPQRISPPDVKAFWQEMDIYDETIYVMWQHISTDSEKSQIFLNYKKVEENIWPYLPIQITFSKDEHSDYPDFKVRGNKIYACYSKGKQKGKWQLHYKEGEKERNYKWESIKSDKVLTGKSFYNPAISVDNNGVIHVIFNDKDGRFYYRYKKQDRNKWRGEYIFSKESISWKRLGGGGDIKHNKGVLVATWFQKASSDVSIFYSIKFINKPWDSPKKLDYGMDARNPCVFIDKEGYVHFVWEDIYKNGKRDVFYKKSDKSVIPVVSVDPPILNFTDSSTKTLKIWNSGEGELIVDDIKANEEWVIKIEPRSGTSTGEEDKIDVTVDVKSEGLLKRKNPYLCKIKISSKNALNSPYRILVNLKVTKPIIKVDPEKLEFEAIEGEINPDPKSIFVEKKGGEILDYNINISYEDKHIGWIIVKPLNGSIGDNKIRNEHLVEIDISGLEEHKCNGVIKIKSNRARKKTRKVKVTLEILPPIIYAPLNFFGKKTENQWMLFIEYINILNWQFNPLNKSKKITKYRVYIYEDGRWKKLGEINSNNSNFYEYRHRNVKKDMAYLYKAVAVDYKNREGYPSSITVK